jgi:hypothetical protein
VALFASGATSGCKAADALSTEEVVVHFAPGASAAQHAEVLQACSQVPHASPVPIPTPETASQQLTDVRFLVHPNSDRNLSRLYNCLGQAKFRNVVLGVDPTGM